MNSILFYEQYFHNYREENDVALAQQLQGQINTESNSIDRTKYNNNYQSFDHQVRSASIFTLVSFHFYSDRIITMKSNNHRRVQIRAVMNN